MIDWQRAVAEAVVTEQQADYLREMVDVWPDGSYWFRVPQQTSVESMVALMRVVRWATSEANR